MEAPGKVPRLVVRPFRPGDGAEARRIFSEGMKSLPSPAFRRALLSPVAPALILAGGGAVYGLSRSVAWAALSGAGLLVLLYLACWMMFANYVRQQLLADMGDIEGSYLRRPGAGFWVAEEEGGADGLKGVVAVRPVPAEDGPGSCELLRLAVDVRCHGRGIGRRLVEQVLEFGRCHGYRRCVLGTSTAQQPAIRLYRRLGFHLQRYQQSYPPLVAFLTWVTNVYVIQMIKDLEEGTGEGRRVPDEN
ncbi:N-acetylaspartate synthetase-like [Hypanus sabinus]|uniref:N-acetylaspartate synthetase-like n=1 Tax=Hypanus sabinus TaxID=79690 RepID=UPI0028C40EEA|nr:N-acetylaspartate synthetase-like [Hypanus sabinus]